MWAVRLGLSFSSIGAYAFVTKGSVVTLEIEDLGLKDLLSGFYTSRLSGSFFNRRTMKCILDGSTWLQID